MESTKSTGSSFVFIVQAIHDSIKKWDCIAQGLQRDRGSIDCPLCKLYKYNSCAMCPVAEKTGQGECLGTPYDGFIEIMIDLGYYVTVPSLPEMHKGVFKTEVFEIVEAEVEFLISLLPEEEREHYGE